ncbi:MAG: sulfotransferase [Methylovulum sp.]|nr:sulfotransferase [Methylovulum sp.]
MKHRFVIGIGSQRAGSTLLHRLLETSTDAFMHPIKELHYFDTLYGFRAQAALKRFALKQLARQISRIVQAKNADFVLKQKYQCHLRTNKILATLPIDKVDYLDLFRPCIAGAKLLGEVTPEYMLLDEPSIEKMKQVIGDDAAVILICRNPVKRFLSAVKLMNVYNKLALNDVTAEAWIQKMLAEQSGWLAAQDGYNNYADTIARYSKHFRHFAAISYDEMVSNPEKTAEQLADVLAIRINPQIFKKESGKVINDLGSDFTISPQTVQQLGERYQTNQVFLDKFFGLALTQ